MANKKQILLVEDNIADADIFMRIFNQCGYEAKIDAVRDGEQALQYLRRSDSFGDAPPVDLVLLDLNLPKKGGKEVLQELKQDSGLKLIPILILSSSTQEKDVQDSYQLGACGYLIKPYSLPELQRTVRAIGDFWVRAVHFPTPSVFASSSTPVQSSRIEEDGSK